MVTSSIVLKAGESVNTPLVAENGTGQLSWSTVSGPALPGVNLSSAGVLSGTPSPDAAEFLEQGRFTNKVVVADSQTDRVTGGPSPRFSTNTLVTVVRLSYRQNI